MEPANQTKSKPSRPRRRIRMMIRALIGSVLVLLLLAGIGLVVVTRSWFLTPMIRSHLAGRLGGNVEIGEVSYVGSGQLVVHDFALNAPGMKGPAAQVLSFERADLTIDLSQFATKGIRIEAIALDGARFRASERAERPGEFNFMLLDPEQSTDDDQAPLPMIRLMHATLEMGTHSEGRFQSSGIRTVTGRLIPVVNEDGWYTVHIAETDERNGRADGIRLTGRFNFKTLEHTADIDGLHVDESLYGMFPQNMKFWCEQMAIQGVVDRASMHWKEGESYDASLDVRDIALTLPVNTDDEGIWARYTAGRVELPMGKPRMRVNDGQINLHGGRLALVNLTGELTSSDENVSAMGMPCVLNLSAGPIPTPDLGNRSAWVERVLSEVPFEATVQLDEYTVTADAGPQAAPELPLPVAQVLARFELSEWTISSEVHVSRSPDANNGTVRTRGSARIRQATGRYEKFPYKLRDINAFADFDEEKLQIRFLDAIAAGGATVSITGDIAPLSMTQPPGVSLRIIAQGVPVDDELREALPSRSTKAFDALFDSSAYERLVSSGVFDPHKAYEGAVKQREDTIARLQKLHNAGAAQQHDEMEELRDEIARLSTIVDMGPFQLGGTVDLDLNVERPPGSGQRTVTTGRINIRNAGVCYQSFPYPFIITEGDIDWQEDIIRLDPDEPHRGLSIATVTGGAGFVRGALHVQRDENGRSQLRPELTFDVTNDSTSDLVLAAIPPTAVDRQAGTSDQWPGGQFSQNAQWLKKAGISGTLSYTGTINTNELGKAAFDFALKLSDGAVRPEDDLADDITNLGLIWPDRFSVEDVEAIARVTRDQVTLQSLNGMRHDGAVFATGSINHATTPSIAQLSVRFDKLALDRYLIDLLPREGMEALRELWDRYEPTGSFIADFDLTMHGSDLEPPALRVTPTDVAFRVGDEIVEARHVGGNLSLDQKRVAFNDLAIEIHDGEQQQGILQLTGSYGVTDQPNHLRVGGTWHNARFESPVIAEALTLFGATAQASRYREHKPQGEFEASFSYESPIDDQTAMYALTCKPKNLSALHRGVRMSATLEDDAAITLSPNRIRLKNIRGSSSAGAFSIDGIVTTDSATEAALTLSYEGESITDELRALLPTHVLESLDAIEFAIDSRLKINDAQLKLKEVRSDAGEQHPMSSTWYVKFDGGFDMEGASFDAGIGFQDVNGSFTVSAEGEPDQPPALTIHANIDTLFVADRLVTDATATITLASDGSAVIIPDFHGLMYGGAMTASARVGLGHDAHYSARVDAAQVGLEGLASARDMEGAAAKPTNGRPSDGALYANISIEGDRNRDWTRRGRGLIRVVDGDIARMPLGLRVLQMTELMPPLSDRMDFADVDFYILGDRIICDTLVLESPTLRLIGEGEMDYDTLDMNVVFRSRGTMAGISDLVGQLSDQLVAIEVTGPLNDPKVRVLPLPGISRKSTRGPLHVVVPTTEVLN